MNFDKKRINQVINNLLTNAIATLFAPFTTTTNVPTNNESKTELGLAIIKKIVELHNGTIHFTFLYQ